MPEPIPPSPEQQSRFADKTLQDAWGEISDRLLSDVLDPRLFEKELHSFRDYDDFRRQEGRQETGFELIRACDEKITVLEERMIRSGLPVQLRYRNEVEVEQGYTLSGKRNSTVFYDAIKGMSLFSSSIVHAFSTNLGIKIFCTTQLFSASSRIRISRIDDYLGFMSAENSNSGHPRIIFTSVDATRVKREPLVVKETDSGGANVAYVDPLHLKGSSDRQALKSDVLDGFCDVSHESLTRIKDQLDLAVSIAHI